MKFLSVAIQSFDRGKFQKRYNLKDEDIERIVTLNGEVLIWLKGIEIQDPIFDPPDPVEPDPLISEAKTILEKDPRVATDDEKATIIWALGRSLL